jgi:choline monooxygenase
MAKPPFEIDADIRRARTPPPELYFDPGLFARVSTQVLARSWHLIADATALPTPGWVRPLKLLAGGLDEPVVLACAGDGGLHCFSNVCTHRGNLVVEREQQASALRCRYHGRRFGLDGRFLAMPEFEGALGFPSPEDDLTHVPLARLQRFVFASLAPGHPFAELAAPVEDRVGWLASAGFAPEPARARSFTVQANWALYVDNYLEGFHIPYVHRELAQTVEYESYETILHPRGTLQIALAARAEDAFAPPPDAPDHGRQVAAYYFWLFPTTMLNFYPWGLSVNLVVPLSPMQTRVEFLAYVADPARLDRGAGAALDQVEHEDEAVVESVQQGMQARLAHRGRYSPTRETGIHHFHRLLAGALAD